ncbi:MAG: DUF2461 domain-containing protein [Desulfomonile tiedjei]|uniref:DUF2461 domain-containing protein n=1 Tax=Desulfomonile tiedjei TaxID=2358 RepID=A0A9D6V019_9BACT|nr:DUF2461 domain-containing protein [Desulfomonile tiedjei]
MLSKDMVNGMSGFRGFPKESVEFYVELAKNNNKAWFSEHKSAFEKSVMDPAKDFVYSMGNLLKKLSPNVIADPRVNGSIFRPYRDTRFSNDKTPYKTHLGIFFWEGKGPKMECSGYYFHLEPPTIFLAAGMHCFSRSRLELYRNSLADSEFGPEMVKAVERVSKNSGYSVGGKHYKKLPRGYTADGKAAELLLHNGLYAMTESDIPAELYSEDLLEYCLAGFKKMSPIHQRLTEMINRGAAFG